MLVFPFGEDSGTKYEFPHPNAPFDCDKIGGYVQWNRLALSTDKEEKKYEKFIKEATTTPLSAMVGVYTISPENAPLPFYHACLYLLNTVRKWKPGYATGIGMRLVQSAKLANKLKDIKENKILEVLLKRNTDDFAAPFLFYSATVHCPIDVEYPIPTHIRTAALQLYYTGVNQMMLRNYEKAQMYFTHSLTLSSAIKEMKNSIVNYLGFACFLNRTPYHVFQAAVPPKCAIIHELKDIFNLKPIKEYGLGRFSIYYGALVRERARRLVIEIAATSSTISYSNLEDMVKPASLDVALSDAGDDISFFMKDKIIHFDEPSMIGRIEREIKAVNESLMPLVKAK